MALWEAFGSRSEYLKAPRLQALKVRLILEKRAEIEDKRNKEIEQKNKEIEDKLSD